MRSRLRRAVNVLLQVDESSHRTALAFGLGVFIAFFPLLGLHTLLALGIAFAFRLNRVAMLLGAYVNNPWTLAPLYMGGTLFGCLLLGVPSSGLSEIDWSFKGASFFETLLASLRPFLWPFLIGNTVLGVAAGAAGYLGLRYVLERRRAGATGGSAA